MQDNSKGILLVIATTFLFAAQDSITKHLGQSIPILQFVGLRYLAFFLFALWWTTRKKSLKEVLTVQSPIKQMIRGTLLGGAILAFGHIVQVLGVGEIQSILMIYPIIVTALSPLLLGEEVGIRRWAAVCVGFVGALIIIAPGSASFSIYSLMALGVSGMVAAYTIMTRLVSRTDSTDSSLLYTAMMGSLISTPFVPAVWVPLSLEQSLFIGVLCLTGTVGHYFLIEALRITSAVILQPFNYLILPWAIGFGYLFFDEIIPGYKWFGIALVVGAGIFVAFRQRQLQ